MNYQNFISFQTDHKLTDYWCFHICNICYLCSKIIFIAIDIKCLFELGGYHVIYIFHSIIIIVYNNPNNLFYSQFYQQRVEGTKNQNVTHTKVFVCIHRELKERMKRNLSYDFVLYKVMITKTKTMLPIFFDVLGGSLQQKDLNQCAREKKYFIATLVSM